LCSGKKRGTGFRGKERKGDHINLPALRSAGGKEGGIRILSLPKEKRENQHGGEEKEEAPSHIVLKKKRGDSFISPEEEKGLRRISVTLKTSSAFKEKGGGGDEYLFEKEGRGSLTLGGRRRPLGLAVRPLKGKRSLSHLFFLEEKKERKRV